MLEHQALMLKAEQFFTHHWNKFPRTLSLETNAPTDQGAGAGTASLFCEGGNLRG